MRPSSIFGTQNFAGTNCMYRLLSLKWYFHDLSMGQLYKPSQGFLLFFYLEEERENVKKKLTPQGNDCHSPSFDFWTSATYVLTFTISNDSLSILSERLAHWLLARIEESLIKKF
jgi:hypothetical protein